MQWGPLVLHSHRIESAKKLTHYHGRSSCLQEKQGASLPGARPPVCHGPAPLIASGPGELIR